MNTTLEVIDNLLAQLDAEPDNRVLIGIAHDALLEAGRDREAEELEPRCWLKAKKRKPFDGEVKGPYRFFFLSDEDREPCGQSDVPICLTGSHAMFATRKLAIQDTVDRWLKLTRKRRDELWQWEPPV